jgi:hypothetical protein
MLTPKATKRRRFLSISRFVFSYCGEISSDVANRIIAVMASQSVMSEKDNGNCISSILYERELSFSEKREYTWEKEYQPYKKIMD